MFFLQSRLSMEIKSFIPTSIVVEPIVQKYIPVYQNITSNSVLYIQYHITIHKQIPAGLRLLHTTTCVYDVKLCTLSDPMASFGIDSPKESDLNGRHIQIPHSLRISRVTRRNLVDTNNVQWNHTCSKIRGKEVLFVFENHSKRKD